MSKESTSGRSYRAVSCQTSTSSRTIQGFKEFFPTQLIYPHQIHLQIPHLPYLSSQHLNHHHYSYPDLHPHSTLCLHKLSMSYSGTIKFPSPSRTQFSSHLFSTHFFPDPPNFVQIWKALLVFMGVYPDKHLLVHSAYVHLESKTAG